MTQSQWGDISFEESYYTKLNEISLKEKCAKIKILLQRIFQPIVHYLQIQERSMSHCRQITIVFCPFEERTSRQVRSPKIVKCSKYFFQSPLDLETFYIRNVNSTILYFSPFDCKKHIFRVLDYYTIVDSIQKLPKVCIPNSLWIIEFQIL